MIDNTAHFNKHTQNKITEIVGKPFSPIDVIKIGTIGSSRMIVEEYSPGFKSFIEQNADLTYASIGLRPKGIVVSIIKSGNILTWAIAYHHLSIYKTDILSIHAEGEYLKLLLQKKQNRKMIEKIMQYKIKYMNP